MAKTTVSIPRELFEQAEAHCAAHGTTRSELVARGLRLVLRAEQRSRITETIDALYAKHPELAREDRDFAEMSAAHAREAIARGDWEW